MARNNESFNLDYSIENDGLINGLKDIEKELKKVNSEVRENAKTIKSNSKDVQVYKKANEDLSKQYALQAQKVQELEKRREELIATGKEGSAQELKIQQQIEKTTQAMETTTNQIKYNRKELTYLRSGINELTNSYREQKEEGKRVAENLRLQGNEMEANEHYLNSLKNSAEGNKRALSTMTSIIARLTQEFGENSEEVEKARKSFKNLQNDLDRTEAEIKGTQNKLNDFKDVSVDVRVNVRDEAIKDLQGKLGDLKDKSVDVAVGATGVGMGAVAATEDYRQEMARAEIALSKDDLKIVKDLYSQGHDIGEVKDAIQFMNTSKLQVDKKKYVKWLSALQYSSEDVDIEDASNVYTQLIKDYGKTDAEAKKAISQLANSKIDLNETAEYLKTIKGNDKGNNIKFENIMSGVAKAQELGIFQTDKPFDGIKEYALRLADEDSKSFKDLMKELNLEKESDSYSSGKTGLSEFTQKLTEKLKQKDKAWAIKNLPTIMGTLGEDLGSDASIKILQAFGTGDTKLSSEGKTEEELVDAVEQSLTLQAIANQTQEALVPLAESMLVVIKNVMEVLSPLLKAFTKLSDESKEIISIILMIAVVLAPTIIIIGKLIASVKTIMATLGSLKLLLAGLSFNPIILAVVAVIAILVLLYTKCEWFRNAVNTVFKALWKGIKYIFDLILKVIMFKVNKGIEFFNTIKPILQKIFHGVWVAIKFIFDLIVKVVKYKINQIKKFFELLKTGIQAIMKGVKFIIKKDMEMIGKIMNIGKTVWNNIKGGFNFLANKITGIVDKIVKNVSSIKNSVKGALGMKTSTSKKAKKVKGYANGTKNHEGGLAMVNDGLGSNYEELITLPNGESFIPKGRNVVLPLPKGTSVLNGALTDKIIPRYANGTPDSLNKLANMSPSSIIQSANNFSNKFNNKNKSNKQQNNKNLEDMLASIIALLSNKQQLEIYLDNQKQKIKNVRQKESQGLRK